MTIESLARYQYDSYSVYAAQERQRLERNFNNASELSRLDNQQRLEQNYIAVSDLAKLDRQLQQRKIDREQALNNYRTDATRLIDLIA